jgi:3-hydroxyacyl-CoA dehydrogenase/3a,7a,12a-trihydroxy-5b-cholest-24-enoyl-CoA hydratase
MWREGDKVVFRCKVKERDKVVITNAVVELHREVPTPKAKAAAQPQPPRRLRPLRRPPSLGKLTSADIFQAIRDVRREEP